MEIGSPVLGGAAHRCSRIMPASMRKGPDSRELANLCRRIDATENSWINAREPRGANVASLKYKYKAFSCFILR